MPTRKQLSLIHVARQQLGLEEAAYRALLEREAGVTSSRDLDAAGFNAVVDAFARLGFRQRPRAETEGPDYGERWGFATPAQVRLLRQLWYEYTDGQGTELSLGKWLQRTYKCSALRFLENGDARKATTALKAMNKRKKAASEKGAA